MNDKYNSKPISVREGELFIDGVKALDGVKFTVTVTPDVWTGRQLGDRTPSSRWLGYAVAGEITRRRSTPFLKEAIEKYKKTGITPEMKLQGIMNAVRQRDIILSLFKWRSQNPSEAIPLIE